ncbi:thymidylate kinase [Pseudonocardia thermophila]|jgi:Thymidylate kinase|uniref:Thymidylate kinase n=1 Tax=Pseudonocardia thermophila TaxID=1848 RepID=A0A1M6TL48_PSETH|nr:dTMP kinase [Pseudonocardia thermophila]SHK57640.1 thymidylate kinase [Pseudonocardia thermophila]
MGRLIVVEGIDGAGKRTLTDRLTAELTARGRSVARFGFPRYGVDEHADLVRAGLYGRLPAVARSVEAMALLYALDRRAAAPELEKALAEHDVVLVDRFTASNAAYGAARLHEAADGRFVAWVAELETELGVPVPDHQLLLSVPGDVAGARAQARESAEPDRARDTYEADRGLQERAATVYRALADTGWRSAWTILDGAAELDVAALASRVGEP